MSVPYYPMYPADFEADTSHLTLEEDGAYNRLLRLCWMTPGCSLPDDPAWIARRMRLTISEYERVVEPLISEFFRRKGGRISSPLLEKFMITSRRKDRRPWIPLSIQRAVFGRDGRSCRYCGSVHGPFHLDHVLPWSRGGSNIASNLVVSCSRCNWMKGRRTPEEMGWSV